jgi:hypothetical protein
VSMESGKEKTKETREENPSTAGFVLITRMEREALEFEVLDRGERHILSMEGQLERTFLLTLECFW